MTLLFSSGGCSISFRLDIVWHFNIPRALLGSIVLLFLFLIPFLLTLWRFLVWLLAYILYMVLDDGSFIAAWVFFRREF